MSFQPCAMCVGLKCVSAIVRLKRAMLEHNPGFKISAHHGREHFRVAPIGEKSHPSG